MEESNIAEVCIPPIGILSGGPHEMPRPPLVASTIGIQLPSDIIRAIHESVRSIEPCALVCKIVGNLSSSKHVQDGIQGALLSLVEIMNVSPLGKGCFRVQFKSPSEASEVLTRSPVDLGLGMGFFARWTQGMDLSKLDVGGLTVTARFPALLPEFVPHLREIGKCIGYVVSEAPIPDGEDRTPCLRMVLPPSLAEDPPRFISLPTIHGGEILQRVFFIGVPGHCFICGRKGHLAVQCTRRRVHPQQRQVVAEIGQKQNEVVEGQSDVILQAQDVSMGEGNHRSEAERARRRTAKKKRMEFARISEGLRVQMVYKRKIPPLVEPSTSTHLGPCGTPELTLQQSSSNSLEEANSTYEALCPTLSESCRNPPLKEPRRSARHKGDHWEHEETFTDDDETCGNDPEERDDIPAPPKVKQEEEDEEAEQEDGQQQKVGLIESGLELKKLFGKSAGLDKSREEESSDDDNDLDNEDNSSPVLTPKRKEGPKEETVESTPAKVANAAPGRTASGSAATSKGKHKAGADESKPSVPTSSKKVKTESLQEDGKLAKDSAATGSSLTKGAGSPVKANGAPPKAKPSSQVTEEDVKAVLKQAGPIKSYDLVIKFKNRLATEEDKQAFAAVLKNIARIHKTDAGNFFVLHEK